MAKNSLYSRDQRRPCTWKCFKSPEQRPFTYLFHQAGHCQYKLKRKSQWMHLIVSSGHFQRLLTVGQLQKTQRHFRDLPLVFSTLLEPNELLLPQRRKLEGRFPFYTLVTQCICFQSLLRTMFSPQSCQHKDEHFKTPIMSQDPAQMSFS